MALRCAIIDDYQDAARRYADWTQLADRVELTVFTDHLTDQDAVADRLAPFDIVVIMRERTPFGASLFQRLPKLKLLVTTGMKNAVVDLQAASAHGVVVCGTASRPEPPAELTWALILACTRHLAPESAAFRTNGPWQSTVGCDLHGRTLGVLGLGKIGTRVARVARAFDMQVLAWSQNLTVERASAEGVELAPDKSDLLERSDIVSIHVVRLQDLLR